MATVVIFDPVATPNKVLSVIPSASSDQYTGRSDALIDPNLSALSSVPVRYWKHVAGSVIEMTSGEKSAQDAQDAAAETATIRSGGKSIVDAKSDYGIIQRAFADIVKDEFNNIRQWLVSFKTESAASISLADFKVRIATLPNMPDRNLSQLRTAIQNRIDSGQVDN